MHVRSHVVGGGVGEATLGGAGGGLTVKESASGIQNFPWERIGQDNQSSQPQTGGDQRTRGELWALEDAEGTVPSLGQC